MALEVAKAKKEEAALVVHTVPKQQEMPPELGTSTEGGSSSKVAKAFPEPFKDLWVPSSADTAVVINE